MRKFFENLVNLMGLFSSSHISKIYLNKVIRFENYQAKR